MGSNFVLTAQEKALGDQFVQENLKSRNHQDNTAWA
jgi:hypothetical protein